MIFHKEVLGLRPLFWYGRVAFKAPASLLSLKLLMHIPVQPNGLVVRLVFVQVCMFPSTIVTIKLRLWPYIVYLASIYQEYSPQMKVGSTYETYRWVYKFLRSPGWSLRRHHIILSSTLSGLQVHILKFSSNKRVPLLPGVLINVIFETSRVNS